MTFTRRSFLASNAALAAGASLPGRAQSTRAASPASIGADR